MYVCMYSQIENAVLSSHFRSLNFINQTRVLPKTVHSSTNLFWLT